MIDTDKEWVSPSEEASEELRERILEEMFPIIKSIAEDEDYASSTRRILEAIPAGSMTLLLDVKGREWDSPGLADEVRRWENDSVKEVAIVIGGPEGVSSEVNARAQKRWRLTRLTLTHEMARAVAVEQLYRAYTINRGLPYQK